MKFYLSTLTAGRTCHIISTGTLHYTRQASSSLITCNYTVHMVEAIIFCVTVGGL